jgi:hypothetical protein
LTISSHDHIIKINFKTKVGENIAANDGIIAAGTIKQIEFIVTDSASVNQIPG